MKHTNLMSRIDKLITKIKPSDIEELRGKILDELEVIDESITLWEIIEFVRDEKGTSNFSESITLSDLIEFASKRRY